MKGQYIYFINLSLALLFIWHSKSFLVGASLFALFILGVFLVNKLSDDIQKYMLHFIIAFVLTYSIATAVI